MTCYGDGGVLKVPRYDYYCKTCGVFELRHSIHDDPREVCPTCGAPVRRLISPPAVHYKGSGYSQTDRRNAYDRHAALEKVKEGLSQDGGDWKEAARKKLPFLPVDDA